MIEKKQVEFVECDFAGLYEPELPDNLEAARAAQYQVKDLESAFAGEDQIHPPGRIPAADSGGDIFFNSRELLVRFAALPTPSQQRLLRKLRKVMTDHNVTMLRLNVRWSGKKTRVIEILSANLSGPSGCLDFNLL